MLVFVRDGEADMVAKEAIAAIRSVAREPVDADDRSTDGKNIPKIRHLPPRPRTCLECELLLPKQSSERIAQVIEQSLCYIKVVSWNK